MMVGFSLVLALIVLAVLYKWISRPKNYPPGPLRSYIPLCGYFPWVNTSNPLESYNQLRKKYGNIYAVTLGHMDVIVVSGWEAVRDTFINDDFIGRPDICFNKDRFNGFNLGMVLTGGDFLKSQKRFTLHHFRNLGFGKKCHQKVILEEAAALIEEFKEAKKPILTALPIGFAALNIIWALMGGNRFSRGNKELEEFNESINMVMHAVPISGNIFVAYPFLRYLFPNYSGYRRIQKYGNKASLLIKRTIQEHKSTIDPSNPRDFMDLYLNEIRRVNTQNEEEDQFEFIGHQVKENKEDLKQFFTDINLEALCIDILMGGSDTTASLISFAILFVSMDMKLQNALHQELDQYVSSDRLPDLEDRKNLVLVDATIMEALRYRNPAPITIPHYSITKTTLGGYTIPKDKIILINLDSVMKDKDYWGDPEVFRPQRFIDEDNTLRRDPRMLPFGKGKRSCVGESLARMSSFLLFASLLHSFKFSLPTGVNITDTSGIPGFTLAPPPYKIIFTPRH